MNTLKNDPAVFAVGNFYHIMIPVTSPTLMWIRVGNEEYFDNSNGILRSDVKVHKIIVPMSELNREKKYFVCYRKIIERKPYFSKTSDVITIEYPFSPVENGTVKAYHIADAHNMLDEPIKAEKNFENNYGEPDFLILNGDVIEDSRCVENFDNIYIIASEITHGGIPIVCTKGNHDNRGVSAEKICEYFPFKDGKSYYSFRLGNIWGLVLDCGEDKNDNHPEYGNTMCCHAFRKEETKYIESLIKDADNEYMAEDVKHKIVVVHTPFTRKENPPFDIEKDIYTHWANMLKNDINIELMLCGHTHKLNLEFPGDKNDAYGHPCPVLIGSYIKKNNEHRETEPSFAGAGIIFKDNEIKIVFTDNLGGTYEENIIPLKI